MKQNYETAADYADAVVKLARSGWINGADTVNGKTVTVKAHGKWIQRFTVNGGPYVNGEFRTQRAMKEFIVATIDNA